MQRIIFFDGDCNLCDVFVSTLFKIDKKHLFLFAPLNSKTAKSLLKNPDLRPDSVIYYEDGNSYELARAILNIFNRLGGIYSVIAFVMKLIPMFLLDYFYKKIAANRYRWFGKKPICRVPNSGEKPYFLD
jgi:predicted DCC family thiol-disulfide oxidoreductase YuxK